MRKLTLTGFLLLIPQEQAMLRLVAALLITVFHLTLLQAAMPFKDRVTSFFAVAISLTLACTFIAALMIKIADNMTRTQLTDTLGFDSVFPITILILIFNFMVLTVALVLLTVQVTIMELLTC